MLAAKSAGDCRAGDLTPARILRDALPGFIDELESSGLPNTLVHGDLHPGNWRPDGTRRLIVTGLTALSARPVTDIERLRDWLPEDKKDVAIEAWSSDWQKQVSGGRSLRALEPMTVIAPLSRGGSAGRAPGSFRSSRPCRFARA
ncbi:hypothetical protein ACQPXM_11860 [Kribbella sp. CA-253562]|uniref:hypothetical protein n=1 Tax=Kribbella sp. CA-253562 TaxID=3239942 RepID=UPI003D9140D8